MSTSARRGARAAMVGLCLTALATGCRGAQPDGATAAESPAASEAARTRELTAWAAEHGGTRYLVPVSEVELWRGAGEPLVTIVVFVDYEPDYAAMDEALTRLLEAHPRGLRVVIKQRPVNSRVLGARAVLAAHAQGRGWAMHELLVSRGDALDEELDEETLLAHAESAGVPDLPRFQADLRAEHNPELSEQVALAERLSVTRSPTIFVNGVPHGGLKSFARLSEIYTAELAIAEGLVEAGARAGEVYSTFMASAAFERDPSVVGVHLDSPYDGPALSTRTLADGVVVEDIELGSGEPLVEGKAVAFWFGGYGSETGTQVMGSRGEPAEVVVNAATRERDSTANALCDAILGMRPGGKRRIRIPAELVEADAPPNRPRIGDLWITLELISIADAPVLHGEDAFSGPPIASKVRPDGLEIHDYAPGEGPRASEGMTVVTHYIGLLEDGTRFDSSHGRVLGLSVTLDETAVLPGFRMGLEGARAGMLRKLVIPPELGWGDLEKGKVPPNSTLIFLLEIVEVQAAPTDVWGGLTSESASRSEP